MRSGACCTAVKLAKLKFCVSNKMHLYRTSFDYVCLLKLTFESDLRARTASLRSSNSVEEATRSHNFWICQQKSLAYFSRV